MITLLGTGHVFDLASALLAIFDERHPDLICVELDDQRYQALIMKQTQPDTYKRAEKNLPLMYKLLARFQDSMANEYGVIAGSEMLAAINYAQSHQLPLELIDMNAQNLFTKMWKSMPMREKLRLLFSGIAGFFISKKTVERELQNIQENFDTYLNEIGKKFPTIKKTLIDDRNEHMVNKLMELQTIYQNIAVCIGDGHIPGMSTLLTTNNIEFQTIRLAELQKQKKGDTDPTSGHFSTTYTSQ